MEHNECQTPEPCEEQQKGRAPRDKRGNGNRSGRLPAEVCGENAKGYEIFDRRLSHSRRCSAGVVPGPWVAMSKCEADKHQEH